MNYKNPPIIEAICEFRISQDTLWDLTIPGLFYEQVKDDFPHKEQKMVPQIELTRELNTFQQKIIIADRVLLFSDDKKRIVQIGSRLLVINVLKPYPTWNEFKSIIEKCWNSLLKIVDIKGLERVSLRYINQIQLPFESIDMEEYFEFYPYIGNRLPQAPSYFIVRVEFPYDEGRDRCSVQLMPGIVSESELAFILDIDYFLAHQRDIDISTVMDWIEKAHGRVEEVFEGCITDKLREVFGRY